MLSNRGVSPQDCLHFKCWAHIPRSSPRPPRGKAGSDWHTENSPLQPLGSLWYSAFLSKLPIGNKVFFPEQKLTWRNTPSSNVVFSDRGVVRTRVPKPSSGRNWNFLFAALPASGRRDKRGSVPPALPAASAASRRFVYKWNHRIWAFAPQWWPILPWQ